MGDLQERARRLSQADYGKRADGTKKGHGWLGELPASEGVMTEKTIGVSFDGKEENIPAIVPGLEKDEIDRLGRGEMPDSVVGKSVEHARKRLGEGRSPYRQRYE